MTGLEKIVNGIKEESDKKATETLNRAEQEAKKILEETKKSVEAECAAIAERASQDFNNILEWGKSAAELKKRQILLTEKQRLIHQVIAEAKQKLSALPDEEYFSMIYKMIERFAVEGNGEILFSKRDQNRLPKDFDVKLKAVLKGKEITLTVSKQTRDITGGFILSYGGVEENCSFDALFETSYETLQDKVYEILFA